MVTFLRTPITRIDEIEAFIKKNAPEGEQLEFKQGDWNGKKGAWTAGNECAKDVASFANHHGGTIVVGVSINEQSQASGWSPKGLVNVDETTITNWLKDYLQPRSFADDVCITPLTGPNGPVLAIDVPASAELIGVLGKDDKRRSLTFPVRMGAHTRYLEYDEMVQRVAVSKRFIYLKLKELVKQNQKGVVFTNPVVCSREGDLPMSPEPWGGPDALSHPKSITSDAIRVTMYSHRCRCAGKLVETGGGEPVDVPFGLIRAAWELGPYVAIAVDGEFCWVPRQSRGQSGYWTIRTG